MASQGMASQSVGQCQTIVQCTDYLTTLQSCSNLPKEIEYQRVFRMAQSSANQIAHCITLAITYNSQLLSKVDAVTWLS